MLDAMRGSKIKENIINLSSELRRGSSAGAGGFAGWVQSTYDGAANRSSKLSLRSVLGRLAKDINIYFPVKEHRDNVLLGARTTGRLQPAAPSRR